MYACQAYADWNAEDPDNQNFSFIYIQSYRVKIAEIKINLWWASGVDNQMQESRKYRKFTFYFLLSIVFGSTWGCKFVL